MTTVAQLFDSKFETIHKSLPSNTLSKLCSKDTSVAKLLLPGTEAIGVTPASRHAIYIGTCMGLVAVHQAYPLDSSRLVCAYSTLEMEKLFPRPPSTYLNLSEVECVLGTACFSVLNIGYRMKEFRQLILRLHAQQKSLPFELVDA